MVQDDGQDEGCNRMKQQHSRIKISSERYAVQMGNINSDGFQCIVRRTDATSGWYESPTLYWTIIQKTTTAFQHLKIVPNIYLNTSSNV
ncbi:unnamed protein product [Clavelina lepadiformis]|uniref:Uncharacterized protein n=1 Tax=Clavelina lepadiformis TaxID=159417 RepID=A0ABP0F5C9_CLALP